MEACLMFQLPVPLEKETLTTLERFNDICGCSEHEKKIPNLVPGN
jgi:hypothetical protein